MEDEAAHQWEVSCLSMRLAMGVTVGLCGAIMAPVCLVWVWTPTARRALTAAGCVWLGLLTWRTVQKRLREGGPWWRLALQGVAISLLSPFLLFAARPCRRAPVRRIVCSAFLVSVLVAWPLAFILTEWRVHRVANGLWAYLLFGWIGCAWAILPGRCPWEFGACFPNPLCPMRGRDSGAVAGGLVVCAVGGFLLATGRAWTGFLLAPVHVSVALLCLVLVLFVPWPVLSFIPRPFSLPRSRAMHPCAVALILLPWATQLLLSRNLRGLVSFVWSRRMYTGTWVCTGGAMDEGSLHTAFFISAWFAIMSMGIIAAMRWLSDRRSRWGYLAFLIPAVLLAFVLLSLHVTALGLTIRYLVMMGPTTRRIAGVVCGLVGYGVLILFFIWALRPPRKRNQPEGASRLESS